MSMKVYNAFKVKNPDAKKLWPLLWKIRDTAEANIREALKAHYWDLVRTLDTGIPEYQANRVNQGDTPEALFRLYYVRNNVRKAYKENFTNGYHDTYGLDVTVGIYPYKGAVYLRTFLDPVSVVGEILDFVPKMPELADYHYQNQTDRPKDVLAKEWRQRRKVWDGITAAYHDIGSHVALEVLSWGSFHRVDPWHSLTKEWALIKPTLPIREEVWAEKMRKLKSLEGVKIEAREGRIRGGKIFSVIKEIDGKWSSIIKAKVRRHKSLNHAADYVWFEFQDENTKAMVRRMMADAKERSAAKK